VPLAQAHLAAAIMAIAKFVSHSEMISMPDTRYRKREISVLQISGNDLRLISLLRQTTMPPA